MGTGPQEKKLAAYRRGFLAEYVAAVFLLFKGYHIAAMRYRSKGGEVDIVARKGDLAIFVEVKAASRVDEALFAVGSRRKSALRRPACIGWRGRKTLKSSHAATTLSPFSRGGCRCISPMYSKWKCLVRLSY